MAKLRARSESKPIYTDAPPPSSATKSTPRKRTPSRKPAATPKRTPASTPRSRSKSAKKSKTPSKKAAAKKSPPKSPARARSRSRSRSRSRAQPKPITTPKSTASSRTLVKQSPIGSLFSGLRSRRGAHEAALARIGATASPLTRRSQIGYWQRIKQSKAGRCIRNIPTQFKYAKVKKHLKTHWKKYVFVGLVAAGSWYSYHNYKQIEKTLNEQYKKLAALVAQQKASSFAQYFSGLLEQLQKQLPSNVPSTTTTTPPPATDIPSHHQHSHEGGR